MTKSFSIKIIRALVWRQFEPASGSALMDQHNRPHWHLKQSVYLMFFVYEMYKIYEKKEKKKTVECGPKLFFPGH